MAWQKVPGRLEKFCDWLNEGRKKIGSEKIEKIYEFSFEAHYRLVYIHPWADGNGRMSRLVMNMIQHEAGVVPSIVKKEKMAEYIRSLAEAQDSDDSHPFVEFMMNHHIENILEQIKEYKESMER